MEQTPRARVWELDAFRGIAILCVIAVHTVFDLRYFLGERLVIVPFVEFVMDYGGVLFVLLSGVCATLGSRSVRRGAIVFGFGLVITLVTLAMVSLGMASRDIVIQFGVLHLLGFCMMTYPLYRNFPTPLVLALGVLFVVLGYVFAGILVRQPYWFVLGLRNAEFASGDYFPVFPHLGWFMLGVVLGRTAYRSKTSLLPRAPVNAWPIRFLCFCGRQSLWIYLLHQPIVYGVLMLFTRV